MWSKLNQKMEKRQKEKKKTKLTCAPLLPVQAVCEGADWSARRAQMRGGKWRRWERAAGGDPRKSNRRKKMKTTSKIRRLGLRAAAEDYSPKSSISGKFSRRCHEEAQEGGGIFNKRFRRRAARGKIYRILDEEQQEGRRKWRRRAKEQCREGGSEGNFLEPEDDVARQPGATGRHPLVHTGCRSGGPDGTAAQVAAECVVPHMRDWPIGLAVTSCLPIVW